MATITRIPAGGREIGGKVYDVVTPCRGCGHCTMTHPDGLGHCVYRVEGFDPNQVVTCGDKWTNIQKRRAR